MQPPTDRDKAKALYWLWKILWMLLFGVFIYMRLVAEGFRILFPTFTKGRVMGIDSAMVAAFFLLLAVSFCWEYALFAIFKVEAAFAGHAESYKTVLLWLAGAVLFVDAALVYVALVRLTWSKGASFSFPAFLATAALVAVIVFVSLVSVNLKKRFL